MMFEFMFYAGISIAVTFVVAEIIRARGQK